jgi:hypothetical protein
MQDAYQAMRNDADVAERKARADLRARVADGYQPSEEETKAGQKLFSAEEYMAEVRELCHQEYAGLSRKERRAKTRNALRAALRLVRQRRREVMGER